jgi:hypothetical protein
MRLRPRPAVDLVDLLAIASAAALLYGLALVHAAAPWLAAGLASAGYPCRSGGVKRSARTMTCSGWWGTNALE